MLEQPALIVAPADDSGRRIILDLDNREVGFAVWERPSWWQGYTLSIHEREDSPLVFTVARRWMWPFRREVRDAEGELIGELAGRRVLDRWGDAVMLREHEHLTDLLGVVLARWSYCETGLRLWRSVRPVRLHARAGRDVDPSRSSSLRSMSWEACSHEISPGCLISSRVKYKISTQTP